MKKIKAPVRIDPVYACESIDKVINVANVKDLSHFEVRLAKAEIAKSISAIDDSLDVAYRRDSLLPGDPNYLPIDASWSHRARKMRKCFLILYLALREQEANHEPTALEIEARHFVQKHKRRVQRQALQLEAFIELLQEELGESAVDSLIGKAAVIADDRVARNVIPHHGFFDN